MPRIPDRRPPLAPDAPGGRTTAPTPDVAASDDDSSTAAGSTATGTVALAPTGGRGEVLPFFRAWLADRRPIGAVAPSGEALAAAMAAELDPDSAPVLELGPGTGTLTRGILARGIPEHRIALVEHGSGFAELLRRRFPRAPLLQIDAASLAEVEPFPGEQVGAVISGLPLLSMSAATVEAILHGAFHHLRAGGCMFQFTYGPRAPVPRALLARMGLTAVRRARVLANLPPAAVYRFQRRDPGMGSRRLAPARRDTGAEG